MATEAQHQASARALLEAGANPNKGIPSEIVLPRIHMTEGTTPLMVAIQPPDISRGAPTKEFVQLLVEGGGNISVTDAAGLNAYDRAMCPVKAYPRKDPEVVQIRMHALFSAQAVVIEAAVNCLVVW